MARWQVAIGVCCVVAFVLFGCLTVNWYEPIVPMINDTIGQQNAIQYSQANYPLAYGCIVDCGSTGSRMLVFSWPTTYAPNQLLNMTQVGTKNVHPGLAAMVGSTQAQINAYAAPLFSYALGLIPAAQVSQTPLYWTCTAGMREVSVSQQNSLLTMVSNFITANYSFAFQPSNARVITGKEEATFTWLAANYEANQLQPISALASNDPRVNNTNNVCINGVCRLRSIGTMDMGGASTELTFELAPNEMQALQNASNWPSSPNNYTFYINLGCTNTSVMQYNLYSTSYLYVGQVASRDLYDLSYFNNTNATFVTGTDPCISLNYAYSVVHSTQDTSQYLGMGNLNINYNSNLTINLTGTGNYSACMQNIQNTIFNLQCGSCSGLSCQGVQQCTMQGYWQPTIPQMQQQFFAFDGFYYTMADFFQAQLNASQSYYNASVYTQLATQYCSSTYQQLTVTGPFAAAWNSSVASNGAATAQSFLANNCFSMAYAYLIWNQGFGIPDTYTGLKLTSTPSLVGLNFDYAVAVMLYETRFFPLQYMPTVSTPVVPSSGSERIAAAAAIIAVLLAIERSLNLS